MTKVEWQKRFGEKLLAIMRERGFGQNQLARESGLSTSRVSDYINGRATPNVFAVVNMSYALNVLPGELVDFDERISG